MFDHVPTMTYSTYNVQLSTYYIRYEIVIAEHLLYCLFICQANYYLIYTIIKSIIVCYYNCCLHVKV